MKRILAALAIVSLVGTAVIANEAAAAKDLVLKGKIAKVEKALVLTTADGKVDLPATDKVTDALLNVDVEVVAKGTVVEKKVTVTEVVSVKAAVKADAPKADAPKADAPVAK
jgi:hypothetical protein